jgi:hypothetical protein
VYINFKLKLRLKIDRLQNFDTYKLYLRSLNSTSCIVIILNAIDPAELQPFKVKTLA